MTDYTREEISERLHQGPATVSFKKKNGETRIMECTLQAELLPPPAEKKTDRVKKPNDEVLSVFDLSKQEWRSFRIENVFDLK